MGLFVVIGPPCSGKSTWVMERAKSTDVVIDADRIAVALSGPGANSHGHSGEVDRAARVARDAVIAEMLDQHHYRRVNVYLIHTCPSPGARSAYLFHNAEIVTLDPGRAEVEKRVRETRPAGSMHGVEKWYRSLDRKRLPNKSSRTWL